MYKILLILLAINNEVDFILCFINKQHALKGGSIN